MCDMDLFKETMLTMIQALICSWMKMITVFQLKTQSESMGNRKLFLDDSMDASQIRLRSY